MANHFNLIVLTPEREFYNGKAESLNVITINGPLTILADHMPTVTALDVGLMTLTADGKTREAFHSEGIMEVRSDCTIVLSQACEWPEEIDVRRAGEAMQRAEKRLEKPQDDSQAISSRIALNRALTRLKLTGNDRRKLTLKEREQLMKEPGNVPELR